MFYIVAIRTQNLKVVNSIIRTISVDMMSFQNLWILIKATSRTLFHFVSGDNITSSYFRNMVMPSFTRGTFFTAKSNICSSCHKLLFAKHANLFTRPFTTSYSHTFRATAMLLRTGWYGFKRFTTNLTSLCYFCKNKTFAPTHSFSGFFCYHRQYYIQCGRGCQCL